MYEVASYLEQRDTVKVVSLCNTGLDDNDMQRLAEAIATSPSQPMVRTMVIVFVCWLLNVPATCGCISGTDLLRQFYVLPH